jgi:hypothetical protein
MPAESNATIADKYLIYYGGRQNRAALMSLGVLAKSDIVTLEVLLVYQVADQRRDDESLK